jgi:hypothetical protein
VWLLSADQRGLPLARDELARYLRKVSALPVDVVKPGSDSERSLPSAFLQLFVVGTYELVRDAGLLQDGPPPAGEEILISDADLREGVDIPYSGAFVTVLTGANPTAVLFAVYAYLEERIGVRWYFPGELGEHVPQGVRFPLPGVAAGNEQTFRSTPAFDFRWFRLGDGVLDEERERTWARRNRMNVEIGDDLGVNVRWWSHTFHKLLPPETHFDSRPEYYALIDGRRVPRQLCTSNPDVVRAIGEAIDSELARDPSIQVVTLDPEDGGGFCECERCRDLDEPDTGERVRGKNTGKYSRRFLIFYRELARLVAHRHPHVTLKSLVYNFYARPPRDTSIRATDHNVLMLAHSACHNHALDDPSCYTNRKYSEYLHGWLDVAPRVGLYEYYAKMSWLNLPFAITHAAKEDIRSAYERGIRSLQSQYNSAFGSSGWLYFLVSKLLWNPEYDAEAGLAAYCRDMYGDAAEAVAEYYRALERRFVDSGLHVSLTNAPFEEIVLMFDRDTVSRLREIIERAMDHASGERARRRARMLLTTVEYIDALTDYLRGIVSDAYRFQELGSAEYNAHVRRAERVRSIRESEAGKLALGRPPHVMENGKACYTLRNLTPERAAEHYRAEMENLYSFMSEEEAPFLYESGERRPAAVGEARQIDARHREDIAGY